MNTVLFGDCRDSMRKLIADGVKVQMCVTSPPYFGLRDYGVDGQLGLEQTPEQYIANMVEVFRLVRDLLTDDGTCWINIGDSYAGSGKGRNADGSHQEGGKQGTNAGTILGSLIKTIAPDCKPKDLIGIPWLLAKALRDPYYTGKIKHEIDRVWLAAMMDGEGTISGFYHDRTDGTGIRTGVNVCLTNTCHQILDRAAEIWPCSQYTHEQNNKRLGTKPVFRWKPSGAENIGDFLAELYPYLMTKKRQAMLAWNLMQFSKDGQKWGKSDKAEEVRQKREVLVRLLSSLNKGVSVVIPDWVKEPPGLYEQGWYLRQDIIWHKPNPMPESVTDRCTKSHEYIFLLSKSQHYYFDHKAIKEPVAQSSLSRLNQDLEQQAGSNRVPGKTNGNMKAVGGMENRNKRSVWEVATQPYSGAHFATFPPALIEPCILAGSRPGDIVLDPFLGSGTTAQVAQALGRNWIGCELNPAYEKLQKKRTEQLGLVLA